jgi:predicted nucleotidyltransferase
MSDGMDLLKSMGVKMRTGPRPEYIKELKDWGISESLLDPIQKDLCPDLWNNQDQLKKEVKDFIMSNFEKWQKVIKRELEVKSITIMGSLATYQYSESSDLDVHIEVELSDKEINEIFPTLPKITLLKTKHPVEYFLTKDYDNVEKSEVAYDLLKDKWVKKPKKTNVSIPYTYIIEIAKFFMAGIEDRAAQYERDKVELSLYKSYLEDEEMQSDKERFQKAIEQKEADIRADLDALFVARHLCKAFRHEAYEKKDNTYMPDFYIKFETSNPNLSINNLVYKMLDKFGYLDRLNKYADIRAKLLEKKE